MAVVEVYAVIDEGEGSGADKEGAGVSVGALPADVIAEVAAGTDALTNSS